MPYEYTPPKYAQVIDELRRRIESGEYPPGSLLPSEHQLSDEFQIARPTVVRALRVLRQDGWIETQQGKGSFVRGRPALDGLALPADRRGSPQPRGVPRTGRGDRRRATAPPPPRVAALLGPASRGDVLARRRLIRQDGEAVGAGHLVGARWRWRRARTWPRPRPAARRCPRAPGPRARASGVDHVRGAGHRPPSHRRRKPSWLRRGQVGADAGRCYVAARDAARAGRSWSWRSGHAR